MADEIKKSTRKSERNVAIILGKRDFGDWKSAFQKFFMPMKGVGGFSEFVFDKKYEIGEVHAYNCGDDKFQVYKLFMRQSFRQRTAPARSLCFHFLLQPL